MTCPCFVCWPLFLQSRLWLWKQKYWGHWQGQFWGKQSSQVSLDQWLMGWFTMKSTLYFLSCVRKLSVYLWRRLTNQKAWERFHLTRERGDSFCCEFCFYCVPKNRIILTLKEGQRFCACVCVHTRIIEVTFTYNINHQFYELCLMLTVITTNTIMT